MGIYKLKEWRNDGAFRGKKKSPCDFGGNLEVQIAESQVWEFYLARDLGRIYFLTSLFPLIW